MNMKLFSSIIAQDFKVRLISQNGNAFFYSALRTDVWHFVHALVQEFPDESGFHNHSIKQWHIPRYVMANAMEYMSAIEEVDPAVYYELVTDLGIAFTPDRNIRFNLRATYDGLGEEFSKSLEQDIPALVKARELVKEKNNLFILPRAKTVHGNPVADESRELIESIAFERLTRRKLDATKFGIYSAFCTQADFTHEQRLPDSDINKLMEQQFGYDPEKIPEDVLSACMEAQIKLIGRPIWGVGIDVSKDKAVRIFSENMSELKDRYSAHYALMIGMHNTSIFLPIAVLYGVIPYRQYLDWMTSSLQPDSKSEQYMIGTTAFLELFGNL